MDLFLLEYIILINGHELEKEIKHINGIWNMGDGKEDGNAVSSPMASLICV